MAHIEFKNLAHAYAPSSGKTPTEYAIHPMNQIWEDGRAYALLGPSGCGKTTLLNVISGLLIPSEGSVYFNDQEVTALSPEQRNIAQVFQFPVVYDTMTVYDNLAFPLKNRGFHKTEIEKVVQSVANVLEIEAMLPRRALSLNAEDKQKIALGRGLVRTDVAAILFDEALTMIDPHQKWLLRRKLKEIHHQFAHTMIYVTHDQSEAMTFADEVAVMAQGKVLQVGSPEELFERPAHKFVGYFIGSPGMNFLPCRLQNQQLWFENFCFPIPHLEGATLDASSQLEVGIRPDYLQLHASFEKDRVPIRIERVRDVGWDKHIQVRLQDFLLNVLVPEDQPFSEQHVFLGFKPDRIKIYSNEKLIQWAP